MADVQITGANEAQGKFLNYYNQYKTQLQQNANPITAQVIDTPQQTLDEIRAQVSEYLRPYTNQAIQNRQGQTGAYRAEADVDAASRGMSGSTWLSDAKNRMSAAEAADIASIESSFSGDLAQQVYNSYQQQIANKLSTDQQNAANKLEADEFNARLYQTLEQLAYQYAQDAYSLNPVVNTKYVYVEPDDDNKNGNSFVWKHIPGTFAIPSTN